jgi:hypothetical protein
MKVETIKLAAVYLNITFIVVAGFFVLYQLATRPGVDQSVGAASIFAGFVGMAIQFLTGSEIAKRAEVAANTAFQAGAGSQPTVTATAGPPATVTTTPADPTATVTTEPQP